MADLDVTENLLDPQFIDPCQLIHRVPTVNSKGENTLVETTVNTYGSVQPANYRAIVRIPDDLRMENVNIFFIKGEITAIKTGAYPDIIVFRGFRYQIKTVEDFTNYGPGFCAGVCVEEVPAP